MLCREFHRSQPDKRHRTFIIHIGPYKTGSTYLQLCLRQNAAALRTAGIVLAHMWEASALKPSHSGLVVRLATERRAELEPVFDAWKGSDATVVISCEDLSAISLEPVKTLMLRELMGNAPATVVFYARRWSELLQSEWQEYVKQGQTLQFLEVLAHNLRDPAKSRIINIDACLSVYAGVFGIANIKVVAYDEVLASGADLFEHFVRIVVGISDLRVRAGTRANRSLTPAQTELMRLFNVLGSEARVDSSRLLRFFELEYPPAPLRDLLGRFALHERSIDLDDADFAVRDVLMRNRRTYARCAVPPTASDGFYQSKAVQARFIGPDYALSPGIAEAVRRLWTGLMDVEKPRSA